MHFTFYTIYHEKYLNYLARIVSHKNAVEIFYNYKIR